MWLNFMFLSHYIRNDPNSNGFAHPRVGSYSMMKIADKYFKNHVSRNAGPLLVNSMNQ